MGNSNSTCIADNVPVFTTQRCNVSPFASPNAMCDDPDPTKCNATTQLTTCAPGYNCPNITLGCDFTYPQFCPPTVECATDRFASTFCDRQGPYEPLLCLPGHYCPDAVQMIKCDAGTYCLRGSTEPKPCSTFSYCPEQTEMRRYYGGLLFCFLFDIVIVLLFYLVKYRIEPALSRRRREAWQMKRDVAASQGEDGFELLPNLGYPSAAALKDGGNYTEMKRELTTASSKQILESGFRKCNMGIRLDLKFDGMTLTLPAPQNKTILSNVSGRIRPGRVTAIMGPSGAGKTTFLNVLVGKLTRTAGELSINGEADEMYRYKKMIGFVPQDDTMMLELTVRENMLYSSRVRLPRHGWTDEDIARHVDAVIDVLGLFSCADTLVANVSGGQRKRANIGLELAMAPAAIFLDEPTSGLDSTAALEVCRTLKSIADLGLTVVAVIHQPRLEIFRSFDDILLLAPGGLTVYMGPQRTAMQYFSEVGVVFQENPADDLLDFIAGSGPACEGALDGGALKALLRIKSASEGGGGGASGGDTNTSFASTSSATTVRPVGTQLAEFWNLAGLTRIAHLRNAMGDPSPDTPRKFEGVLPVVTLRSSVQTEDVTAKDEVTHERFDADGATSDRGAGFTAQMLHAINRSLVQQYRTATSFALELGVAVLAGGMMGAAALAVPSLYIGILRPPYVYISPSPIENLLPSIGLFVALAIGVAASPAGVKIFGEEREVYFREASAGHNRFAYYTAKSLAVLPRLTLGAFHFVSIFHFLARPATGFELLFINVWCQYFCVYGLSAITSMLVKRENAALLGVIISLIAACLNGYGPNLKQGREWGLIVLQDLSFARWANEAWFHTETFPYRAHFMVQEVSAGVWGYTLDRFGIDITLMIFIGFAYRVVALCFLVGLNRERQR